MLATATPNSTHAFSDGSTPPNQDPSLPRSASRVYLDVFNPPVDAGAGSASPRSFSADISSVPVPARNAALSPASVGVEVSCSPSNYPTSFAQHAIRAEEAISGSPSGHGGQSPSLVFRGIPGSPALNIRRAGSSASINRDLEDFNLGESLQASKEGGILHHHHHYPGNSPIHNKYSPRTNTRRQFSLSELTHDDILFAATTEEVKNPDMLAKHHDALHSALVTPPSGRVENRRPSIADLGIPAVPIEETTVSDSIPLYEVPQDMMVPLLDRPNDMKGLLAHRSCDRSLHILRNVIGEDAFNNRLMKLWVETDRKEVSDAEWLWKTKSIIMQAAGDGDRTREWKLWGDFCEMVGFDEEDTSIDRDEGLEKKRSGSPPVDTMEKIGEEEEEAEAVKA